MDQRLQAMRRTALLWAAVALAAGFLSGLVAAVPNRPVTDTACRSAVIQANRVLTEARQLRHPRAGYPQEAAVGRFDQALARYRQAASRCPLSS